MNTAVTDAENGTRQHLFRTANRLWRRAGVRGVDRKNLLTELEAELDGARHDGHSASTVLGEDSALTLRQWADERDLSGRAFRLSVVVPVALLGVAAGLAVVLLAVFAAFTDRPTIDFGPFVLPMYASAGAFAYLSALLSVWVVLRLDPHASSTIRYLAVLLPLGAVASSGSGYRYRLVEKLQHQLDSLRRGDHIGSPDAGNDCRDRPLCCGSKRARLRCRGQCGGCLRTGLTRG